MAFNFTRLILIAFLLLLLGVVLPFLMIMKVLESTFFLNLIAFLCSLAGVTIGVIASAYYVRINRKDQ